VTDVIWKITRPRFWMLDRQVRRLPRFAIPLAILLLGVGGQLLYHHFLQDKLTALKSEQGVAAVASFLPSLFLVFLVSTVLGLGDMLYQLYLASDLEVLMAAPIPNHAIFGVKLIQCSRATVLPAVFAGGLLVASGLAREASVIYYLLITLLLLATMATAMAAMISLVLLLGRLIPPQQTRSWLPLALALLSVLFMPLQLPATQWFLTQSNLTGFLNRALLNRVQLAILTAGIAGTAIVLSLVAYQIFDRAFYNDWNRFQVVSTRRSTRRQSRLARWVRPLPSPLRFFLVKEWLTVWRTPQGLINLTQPLMIGAVMTTFAVAGGRAIHPLLFWLLLVFMGFYLTMAGNSVQMVLAFEGRNLALLRSTPIPTRSIVRGKFWATWAPNILTWSLVILIFGLVFALPTIHVSLLLAISCWGMTGVSIAAAAVSALTLDFSVQDPGRRLPGLAYWLIVGLNLLFTTLTITSGLWLFIHLAPTDTLTIQLEALAGLGVVRMLLSDSAKLPLLLAVGQILFGITLRVLWTAGVSRLSQYEEV
jgi:hypothetical protein